MLQPLPADLVGFEFDWFAVDREGYVAHLATGGYGQAPASAIATHQLQSSLLSYLRTTPGVGQATLCTADDGDYTDWLAIAAHGIYAYDWAHWDGPYRLIALPERPITVDALPPAFRATVLATRLADVCFRDTPAIARLDTAG